MQSQLARLTAQFLLAAALLIVLLLAGAWVATIVAPYLPYRRITLGVLFAALGAIAAVPLITRLTGQLGQDLARLLSKPHWIAAGSALGSLIAVASITAMCIAGACRLRYGVLPGDSVIPVLISAVSVAILEELFFSWLLFTALSRLLGITLSALVCAVLFAVFHIVAYGPAVVPVTHFAFALVTIGSVVYLQSISFAIGYHFGFDLFVGYFWGLPSFSDGALITELSASWLRFAPFVPGIFHTIVLCAFVLLIVRRHRQTTPKAPPGPRV